MDIILTLTSIGTDQGTLFDLYSNTNSFASAFETSVPKASLQAGYTTSLAPAGTTIVRICGQEAECDNCVDISPLYTTTTSTTLPPIGCEETTNSGGVGVTEYSLPLEPLGGILVMDFNAYGIPDKLEIIHNGIKVATSGMTTANAGPFDNLYGDPTVPSNAQALATDQFIGTQKAQPPTREADILADTGLTFLSSKQQLIWWEYTSGDVLTSSNAIVRVTGPSGTAWALTRLCSEITTTTTTTSTSSTTTTTTTAVPTTTTTTTLAGLEEAILSLTTHITNGCSEDYAVQYWIDTSIPATISVGDVVYYDVGGTLPYLGNGDYYKLKLGGGVDLSARITASGVILAPILVC